MDKVENMIGNYSHSINIVERKNLMVTGVKKIDNFDSEEFLLQTTMGCLVIKGSDLELVKYLIDCLNNVIRDSNSIYCFFNFFWFIYVLNF